MSLIPYTELYDKADILAKKKTCLECGNEGALEYADDEVLVCRECGFSIEASDLLSEWLEKLIADGGYYD